MREQFQVDLRGIVDILSHHLYSSEQVYVRELLQNARDAIEARRRIDPTHEGRITILPAEGGRPLRLSDNGIGLTDEEMRRLLATIGSSSKRDDLEYTRRKFLGQFGIGLLSCFLVADTIDVLSRSMNDPEGRTIRWVGHADGTFEIAETDEVLDAPGTQVRVSPRHGMHEWCSRERVRELVGRFAELLDVPVTVEGELRSCRTPPWDLDTNEQLQWCVDNFGFEAMGIIPLDASMFNVRGLGFVLPYTAQPGYRTGDRIYSNGMLVSDSDSQVIPDWAFFCRAVIDAGDLPLTASREALLETNAVELVRDQLGGRLLSEMILVLGAHPGVFEDIVRLHATGLKSLAARGRDMRDLLRSTLTFPTTLGSQRISDLVQQDEPVPFVADSRLYNALQDLAAGVGRLVVDAGGAHDAALLRTINDDEGREVFREIDRSGLVAFADPRPYADHGLADRVCKRAEGALAQDAVRVQLVDLEPPDRPVLWWPEEEGAADGYRSTLLLNGSSDVVRAMLADVETRGFDVSVQALYPLALLLGRAELTEDQLSHLERAVEFLVQRRVQPRMPD